MRPPLPRHYFGNAVFRLHATGVAGNIGTMALGSIAAHIKGAIKRMDDELVRSAIDYFEMAKMNKSRPLRGSTLPQTDLSITSWLGRPQYDADFGWGKPQLMSRAESARGGLVHLMNNGGTTNHIKELGRLLYVKLKQAACGVAPSEFSKDELLQVPTPIVQESR
jgi:shikimate O-hydroxycinnamoyltransferase